MDGRGREREVEVEEKSYNRAKRYTNKDMTFINDRDKKRG